MSLRRIDMAECHQILLQIAACFDQLCNKHDIPYYMLGGTMLGAIRHQGFIPLNSHLQLEVLQTHYLNIYKYLDSYLFLLF